VPGTVLTQKIFEDYLEYMNDHRPLAVALLRPRGISRLHG
jgi:hypothetical protein